MSDEKEAVIERISYTVANCPECGEHETVDDFGSGDITCANCGEEYHWNSEI